MEGDGDIIDKIPCSTLAVDAILRIGTAGMIWGLCSGPYDARKKGLTGIARASFVAKTATKYGLQCGLLAGIYSTTHCGIQRYRRKKDSLNAAIAGALAGAVIAARTRSRTQVFGMAALVSAVATAAEFSTAT